MTGRRTIVGLCLLCALAFSAFAAQGASAATKGTTQFTCKEVAAGTGTFTKAHCKPGDAGKGDFSHVTVAENETTELVGSNEKTNAATNGAEKTILHANVVGLETEIVAATVHGTGSATNLKDPTGEHFVEGTGVINYTGAELLKPQPTKCKLEKTEYSTKELRATTTGQGDFLKFEPKEGETFIEFNVISNAPETCPASIIGNYKVTGSIKGTPEGATTTFTRAGTTEQNTLKLRGQKAGVEGKLTISGRAKGSGGTYTPLSVTTIETP